MADFTLDTSGAVVMGAADHNYEAGAYRVCRRCGGEPHPPAGEPRLIRWSDLSPFAQGYAEALFASQARKWGNRLLPMFFVPGRDDGEMIDRHFSDLSPEALALILRDCEAFRAGEGGEPDDVKRLKGGLFWTYRQRGEYAHFPPQTPYLSDDGRVCLKARA